jgi:hypothetical protein
MMQVTVVYPCHTIHHLYDRNDLDPVYASDGRARHAFIKCPVCDGELEHFNTYGLARQVIFAFVPELKEVAFMVEETPKLQAELV